MDKRYRVYYLVNLNQNYKLNWWWSKGWDNYGVIYDSNMLTLVNKIKSLKITENKQLSKEHFDCIYFGFKISCKKEEENTLVTLLNKLKDCNYLKI